MTQFTVKTEKRIALIDITAQVNDHVARSASVSAGLCNLFVQHTTAALIVSENWDPDVTTDLLKQLERLVPREAGFKHSEGNSQAHILSAMIGPSLNLPIREGKLSLGRWQGVMLAEFDGPRDRTIIVTILPA